MTGRPSPPPPPRAPAPYRPDLARVALVFVLLSLLALVLAPLLVHQRIDRLRDHVDFTVEPARGNVTEIQYYLARKMAALRGYMLTDDPRFLERYNQVALQERQVRDELRPMAQALGPDALRLFAHLDLLSDQWAERLASDPSTLLEAGAEPFVQAQLYDEMANTAAALDQALAAVSRDSRTVIREVERVYLRVTVVLVLLAVGAALVVGWIGHRVRVLGDEAGRALHEAHRLMEDRSRLLRGITHDVKNPLAAADGYAQLLELGIEPLSSRQTGWVAGLRRSLRGALGMIDDLLELDRAGSADIQLARQEVDLGMLLREVSADHSGAAEAAGHKLGVLVPDVPVRVSTDRGRVMQILSNLVGNAIKYTPAPGDIRLVADRIEDEGEGEWAVVQVRDNGPGIPPHEQERIFEEFHRLEPGEPGGHGVGLTISRRLASALGGRITVDSAPGEGSTFSLWLPPGGG